MEKALPIIPEKRYFTIGEVSELCGVKPYVLRYWEQEFAQLKPMKRRGNRRYYQHHEVLLIRRIRDLLYDQGFTISGARNQLVDVGASGRMAGLFSVEDGGSSDQIHSIDALGADGPVSPAGISGVASANNAAGFGPGVIAPIAAAQARNEWLLPEAEQGQVTAVRSLRAELLLIRDLLSIEA